MKTSLKTLLTTLTLAGATLLTGCATPNLQATFTRGDEVIYGRVDKVWDGNDSPLKNRVLCGPSKKYAALRDETYTTEVQEFINKKRLCEMDDFRQIQAAFGVVNANGDMFVLQVVDIGAKDISRGDIVAVKVYPSSDGRFRRPAEILRVAAKAKDATKENGCYWDAGTGTFRGFNQGGVICEGWHWKNHPYSNPSLLKK